MKPGRVGLLGGTFDPIHIGHVEVARRVREVLALDYMCLVPSCAPPHRTALPTSSAWHRFAMASIATGGLPGVVVDDIELARGGMSYTIDTLTTLAQRGFSASQLFVLTGADAFAEIATWRAYPVLLDAACFVVVARPGFDLEGLRDRLPHLSSRFESIDARAGDAFTERVRGQGGSPLPVGLLPIETPDVSATDLRRRLGAGEAVGALLPRGVEDHIRRHGLYTATTRPGGATLA